MAKIISEITCITGSYTNSEGAKKNRYLRIGSIIETKNGPMLKLDQMPLKEGGWDGWAYINEPQPKDGQRQAPKSKGFDDMNDDMPF
tara:strand:+ start:1134 stop:1394 length:261 start_codon:yes stop_codon:yes gene_type:complete